MTTVVKTYKSRKSHQNQTSFMRGHFNQVRLNKEDKKFKKVQTSGNKKSKNYNKLLDEFRAYKDYEYICAGLNSFERELLIIDCDDTDSGCKTMNLLARDGLVPHYQKVKSNGHSQTGFFIKKEHIAHTIFDNGTIKEVDNENVHLKFKRTYQMLNFLYNGDLGFTGFNCQNPLYVNGNVKSFKNYTDVYTLDELYNFCLDKMKVTDIDSFLKSERAKEISNKPKTATVRKAFEVLYIYLDEINKQQSLLSTINPSIITNVTVEDVIDAIISINDSYNKDIFVTSTRVCRDFWKSGKLIEDNKEYVEKVVYKELCKLYNTNDVASAIDYTQAQLLSRIREDVIQIYQKAHLNKMEWNKVGYTKEQRERSAKTRGLKSLIKQTRIEQIINENPNLSLREVAKEYENIYNEKISQMTVKRLKTKINDSNNQQINPSIITNVTVTDYHDLNMFYAKEMVRLNKATFARAEESEYITDLAAAALSE